MIVFAIETCPIDTAFNNKSDINKSKPEFKAFPILFTEFQTPPITNFFNALLLNLEISILLSGITFFVKIYDPINSTTAAANVPTPTYHTFGCKIKNENIKITISTIYDQPLIELITSNLSFTYPVAKKTVEIVVI